MARFKINIARMQERETKKEQERKMQEERGKEMLRKYPDRYKELVDAVDIPYKVTGKGTQYKLAITVKRNDEDETDIVNEVMLDIRTLFKKAGDEEWTFTKKGIHIPFKYAEHLANTLLEVVEDVKEKKISF